MTFSICLIVKNEEKTLPRLLPSLQGVADEIVIVDTGSTDRTKEVASAYSTRIFDFPWCMDFSRARNFAFSQAKGDYLMWLDADDILPDASRDALQNWKRAPGDAACFYLPYHTAFDKAGNPTFTYRRERIVRRDASPLWVGRVHETLSYQGTACFLDIPICHHSQKTTYSTRNLDIYEAMRRDGDVLTDRDRFYYGRELYYHKYYARAKEVLESVVLWHGGGIEDTIEACRILSLTHLAMGEQAHAVAPLLHTLSLAPPRPAICYDIGKLLFAFSPQNAEFWWELALSLPRQTTGFREIHKERYFPALELCLLHDKRGDKALACAYNDLAGKYCPRGEAYLHNKSYYATLGITPKPLSFHTLYMRGDPQLE